ncbi:MAG TPA: NYN domain-containing protein [Verrucomicrobiae bacterium]|nr:NYN domain-containing protein [Verrucomicrobiae bacterium]
MALPSSGMALVRILVDGYSLLHNWPELAPGKPRHSEDARAELIRILTLYRDACGTPITIVFDGAGKTPATAYPSTPDVEILYSRSGQTADQIIERVTVRMEPFGEVLAVTDDYAERDTVAYHGGLVSSCANFIETVERTLLDQERDIHRHNRKQRAGFKAPR